MSRSNKILVVVVIAFAVFWVCRTLVGFLLLGSSIFYVNVSSMPNTEYFMTVGEVFEVKNQALNKPIRISGVVLGDSIKLDESSGKLSFLIADIPADYSEVEQQGGLAVVLEKAVNDPARTRIEIVYFCDKPELLRHMAQAILTGELHSDGIFYAEEILLRCPSRYEEEVPDQAVD